MYHLHFDLPDRTTVQLSILETLPEYETALVLTVRWIPSSLALNNDPWPSRSKPCLDYADFKQPVSRSVEEFLPSWSVKVPTLSQCLNVETNLSPLQEQSCYQL